MIGIFNFALVLFTVVAIVCVTVTFVQMRRGDRESASFWFAFGIVCIISLILISLARHNVNSRQGTYTFKDGEYTVYIDGDRDVYYIDTLRDKVFRGGLLGDLDTGWSVEEFNQILKDRGLTERR